MALNEFEIEITGLEELDRRLGEFGPEFARECVTDGVEAMAVFLARQAQINAPVMTKQFGSRKPGELRDSIGVIMEKPNANYPYATQALVTPIYEGGGIESPGVWGKFVEYGSIHNPEAHPFLRPAVDEHAREAIEICVSQVRASFNAMAFESGSEEA